MGNCEVSEELVARWAATLPTLQIDRDFRSLDAEIHRVLSQNLVRKAEVSASRVVENDLPLDASMLDKELAATAPLAEDWIEERHNFESDYIDETGQLVDFSGLRGYETVSGKFVAKPELVPVPRYTTDIERAFVIKRYFIGDALRINISETEGPELSEFVATFKDSNGFPVRSFQHFVMASAVVGATFAVIASGWRGNTVVTIK